MRPFQMPSPLRASKMNPQQSSPCLPGNTTPMTLWYGCSYNPCLESQRPFFVSISLLTVFSSKLVTSLCYCGFSFNHAMKQIFLVYPNVPFYWWKLGVWSIAGGLGYSSRDDLYALRRKCTPSQQVQLVQLGKVCKDFGTLSICK